jgi:16S rRNA processing protein RimM
MSDDLVLIGAIAGAFGVKGEIRVRSFTGDPEALIDYGPFLDAKGKTVLTVKSWRALNDGLAIIAKEVATREDAMAMRNVKLFVPRDRFPEADDDEYYHVDLIGLRVEALDGAPLGTVKNIIPGVQDLLDIASPRGPWLLPFTQALVPIVDISGKRLVADVPDGLLPDEKTDAEKPEA